MNINNQLFSISSELVMAEDVVGGRGWWWVVEGGSGRTRVEVGGEGGSGWERVVVGGRGR